MHGNAYIHTRVCNVYIRLHNKGCMYESFGALVCTHVYYITVCHLYGNGVWIIQEMPVYCVNAGRDNKVGWAFGLGLERLAMILFQISDIRLFWSDDERFLSQFSGTSTQPMTFKPFSKHPPCYKDISFWINSDQFTDNNFFEVVRSEAGDIAECVNMV